MSIIKKLFGTLAQKPWEENQAAIDQILIKGDIRSNQNPSQMFPQRHLRSPIPIVSKLFADRSISCDSIEFPEGCNLLPFFNFALPFVVKKKNLRW